MYLDYYGFKEKPFGLTPDTRFLFLSKNHQEVFAHLWYGLQQGSGFVALSGEIGTGKTIMLRALLARLDDKCWRSALIFNPASTAASLLREILREFGLPCNDEEESSQLVRTLNSFLLRQAEAGFSALLILDEAQNLRPEVLEEIRLLSNLETENRKLLHIILAGQPELRCMLSKPELRQLDQRISVRYHSKGMDEADTCRYIGHRLKCAGGSESTLFSRWALGKIYRYSAGIPRLINILCDRCLLLGFTSNQKFITSGMVGKAIRELQPSPFRFSILLRNPVLQLFCLVSLFFSQAFWLLSHFLWLDDDKTMARGIISNEDGDAALRLIKATQDIPSNFAMFDRDQAVTVFNAMAKIWKIPELGASENVEHLHDLWAAARVRGLRVSRVRGSLADLLGLNYPVLFQEQDTGRLIALLEERQGIFLVTPSAGNHTRISFAELTSIWKGEAFLLWRNQLALPSVLLPKSRGDEVRALQELLILTGASHLKIDGIHGVQTAKAIQNFQLEQGLQVDDALGMRTLLRLYQAAKRFNVPELEQRSGARVEHEHHTKSFAEG